MHLGGMVQEPRAPDVARVCLCLDAKQGCGCEGKERGCDGMKWRSLVGEVASDECQCRSRGWLVEFCGIERVLRSRG